MTLEAFGEAGDKVHEVIRETKLIYPDLFSKQSGSKIYFKPENLQQTGTYKVYGTHYKTSTVDESAREKSLIATSIGSRVQGITFATKLAGMEVATCMSAVTPLMEINRTKALGAKVVLSSGVFDDTLRYAYEVAAEIGATFAHSFNDLTVVTDQGSIAMEIVKELPTVDYILVLIDGGGLASSVSALAKLLNPNVHMTGVEPRNATYMKASLAAGGVAMLPSVNTIVDGTAVKRPGEKIFPYIQKNPDGIITVQDNELIVSFLDMVENHKMIVKNSGLLTVAALRHLDVGSKRIVSILSDGSMNVIMMASLIQHGLIQRGHVSIVLMLLPDKPGQPVRVAEIIAEKNGNVIKLEHNQLVSISRNMAVELRITVGASGTKRREEIYECLEKEEYHPKPVCSRGTYGE